MSKRKNKNGDNFASAVLINRRLPLEQITGALLPVGQVPIDELARMVQNDETITACLGFITSSVLARLGDYANEDKEIEAFVSSNFAAMRENIEDIFADLLGMIWAGFAVLEIVTREEGGFIVLDRVLNVDQKTLLFHLVDDYSSPNYGEIDYIIQAKGTPWESIIPVQKCIIAQNILPGFPSSPYGCSRLQSVNSIWRLKNTTLTAWGETLERFGSPITMYEVEDDRKKIIVGDGDEAEAVPIVDYIASQHNSYKNLAAWISTTGNKVSFVFPPVVGASFETAQAHFNQMICRGLLVPSLVFDTGAAVQNLSAGAFELFLQSIDDLARRVTKAAINQLVRPLIVANFGEQPQYGYFNVQESKQDLLAWAYAFSQMMSTGALAADNLDDLNVMRTKMGLEPFSELPVRLAELATRPVTGEYVAAPKEVPQV